MEHEVIITPNYDHRLMVELEVSEKRIDAVFESGIEPSFKGGSRKFRKRWPGHLPTYQLYRYSLFFWEFYHENNTNFKGKRVAEPTLRALALEIFSDWILGLKIWLWKLNNNGVCLVQLFISAIQARTALSLDLTSCTITHWLYQMLTHNII